LRSIVPTDVRGVIGGHWLRLDVKTLVVLKQSQTKTLPKSSSEGKNNEETKKGSFQKGSFPKTSKNSKIFTKECVFESFNV